MLTKIEHQFFDNQPQLIKDIEGVLQNLLEDGTAETQRLFASYEKELDFDYEVICNLTFVPDSMTIEGTYTTNDWEEASSLCLDFHDSEIYWEDDPEEGNVESNGYEVFIRGGLTIKNPSCKYAKELIKQQQEEVKEQREITEKIRSYEVLLAQIKRSGLTKQELETLMKENDL